MEVLICTLLLATCGAAVSMAAFATGEGVERRIKGLFLACCAGLAAWAFGLAVSIGARDPAPAALGDQLAVLGWSFTACMILTFLLALTGSLPLLKKKWFLLLAYLPSVLDVLFYVVPLGDLWRRVVARTGWGRTGAGGVRGLWSWVDLFQTVLFLAVGLGLLARWIRRSRSSGARRQALMLLIAFPVTGILCETTDILPAAAGVRIPSFAAAFMLIPIAMIAYSIRKYHFLRKEEEDPNALVLTNATRSHVYIGLGLAAFALALLNLAFCRRLAESRSQAILLSVFWLLAALCLVVSDLLKVDGRFRELIIALGLSFVVPATMLWSAQTGNLVFWVCAFVLMLAALLFNQLIILAAVASSFFLTQLFVWAYQPDARTEVSLFAYAVRLTIIAVTAALSLYIHHVYVRRLRENANHALKQELVSETSHSFISAEEDNLDEKLHTTLGRCGRLIRCDRAYLILLGDDGKSVRHSCEWLGEGIPSGLSEFEESLKSLNPMMRRQMKQRGMVILRDAAFLPPMAGAAKRRLKQQGIRSLVTIPLGNKGKILGFLGFNAGIPFRKWNLEDPSFLEVIAGVVLDAVLKVEAEKQIKFIAYHDQLTGLPNRLLFNDRLTQAISLADRSAKMLAVVFVDLDSFKSVNDTMGHDLGDQLLREAAQALTRCVRGYDTVSRFGGDEFILLINQLAGTPDLLRVLEKLAEALRRPVLLEGQEIFVTASMGAALYPQDGTDAEALVKSADTAMYSAKEKGKNRYALCSQDMKDEVLDRMKLSNLLYRALEKDQLALYYQPQVDVKSRAIVGSEALIRWNLPERGMVMPSAFIPLAEQTGLIQPIGAWVLETACRQNREWREMGFPDLRIAVNLSVHQLKNPNFVQQVGDILEKTGLPPRNLELEVTESVANGNADGILDVLSGLKSLGVSIAIDDFGTEYSSLSRLKLLPVDRIKMDMQFVQGIEKSEKDQAISKVIINLAQNLSLKVIAEGVETAPQMDFLSRRMCDEVQGFYYYRPMPAERLEAILCKSR